MWGIEEEHIVGKTIASVEVTEGDDTMTIVLTDGTKALFEVYGDCCSRSWIEHVTIPPDIEGATITEVKEAHMGHADSGDSWESIQVYNTAFVTPKGEVIVEYRNSSNGYYGGSMNGPYIS